MSKRSNSKNPDIALALEVVNVGDGIHDQTKATEAVERVWQDRIAEVLKEWHNNRVARAGLAAATILAVGLVVALFFVTSYQAFDAIAKFVTLGLSTLITIVLLREDPFHEGLGPNAGYLDRLKVQGKLIAMSAAVGLVFGVLGLYASNRAQEEERNKVNGTAASTLETLKALDQAATSSLQDLDKAVQTSIYRLDELKKQSKELKELSEALTKQSEELKQGLDKGVLATLVRIPQRTELLGKHELIDKLDGLVTRASLVDTLRNSSWGQTLVTTESLLSTLVSSSWGQTLVTTRSLPETLKNSRWGQTLVTTESLPGTLEASAWGKSLVKATDLERTLEEVLNRHRAGSPCGAPDQGKAASDAGKLAKDQTIAPGGPPGSPGVAR